MVTAVVFEFSGYAL
ncbi:hypothetical protein VCEM1727_003088A, partial [Vibrio cholerae O1 str. EM-1727]